MSTLLTNARLILEHECVLGTVAIDDGRIRSVDSGGSTVAGHVDLDGDYLAPGLIEMHTDNLEKHLIPRPGVMWPNAMAAALAHDAQMAAAGVTTVYDALCAGYERGSQTSRAETFTKLFDAIESGVSAGVFRIDHALHLRCELSGADLVSTIEPHMHKSIVRLASLMDHTPGQRQWRDIASYKTYSMGISGMSESEFERYAKERVATGHSNAERNWPIVTRMFKERGIPLATHDDTTVEHVEMGAAAGAVISEFPTTVAAATAAHQHGMATIAGAPNVVRGGSHSGGVSAAELAERGILDGLSSDYVPASLLQAVHKLTVASGIPLPEAMGMVTWRVADILGLDDRGHLKPGLRADLVQFRIVNDTPVVRGLWSAGRRVL